LDYFYRHLPKHPGRLLDVGCGNGSFLLRAQDCGWKVEGIEPDPMAAERGAGSGLKVHHGNILDYCAPGEGFDVITLSHVFEHLHNPKEVLERCLALLKPGGTLWMSMPNIEGVGHQLYKKAWFALDPPRHLLLPSRHELKRLCADAGFAHVELLDRGRSGSGLLRLSAQRARTLGMVARFDRFWILLSNVLSVFDTRYSDEMLVCAKKGKI
jgi:SAM-dependent methyltransferase